MSSKGYVMDVQPFSVNDGDGIRTTVFLAGCPLRCQWCSNPEGFLQKELIGWHQRKCIGCGACAEVCPQGIGIDLNAERDKCIACGKCTEVCPVQSRVYMVRLTDADDVLEKVQKHRIFYTQSGGGVTFSGGEPTSQPDFLRYLAEQIYDLGYSMDIETTGQFEFEKVRDIFELMDLIFVDLKHTDPEKYRRYTGGQIGTALNNLKKLSELPARIVVRIPVIEAVSADEDTVRRLAASVRQTAPDAAVELLPYHEFGRIKYEAIGIPYHHPEFSRPSDDKILLLKNILTEEGVKTADFR